MQKILFVFLLLIALLLSFQVFGLSKYLNIRPNITTNNQPTKVTEPAIITQAIYKPIIGIRYRIIDKTTATQNNLVEGAYVSQIITNSPAEKAGLQVEDIITEINGKLIAGLDIPSVYSLVSTLKSGSSVNLKVWRNGVIKSFLITLD